MRWWNRETARQLLPTPLMALGLLVPGNVLLRALIGWSLYAACYLVLTWLTFRNHEPATLMRVVGQSRRRTRSDRWFGSTPDNLSQGAAVVAMASSVVALPRATQMGLPIGQVLVICVVAIVTSWMVMHAGFLARYMGAYAEFRGMEFPGDEEPGLLDFAYFTIAIGTTFGTTDVSVTRREVRRIVLSHGILSFVFNTLVLAVAVTFLSTFITAR